MDDDVRDELVDLTVFIAARAETVFTFFEDPDRLLSWLGARMDTGSPGFSIEYPNGHTVQGEVVESRPPERFVFTWGYRDAANGLPVGSTRVTVTLSETPQGTAVRLRHEGIEDERVREAHRTGWMHFLGRLAATTSAAVLDSAATELVDAYVSAWNRADPGSRARLLEQCWQEDGVFKDAMSYVRGRDALNSHVESARAHMPDVQLERTSPVQHTHDWIRFQWRIVGPDGAVAFNGTNVGVVDADGRIREMVGFADPSPHRGG